MGVVLVVVVVGVVGVVLVVVVAIYRGELGAEVAAEHLPCFHEVDSPAGTGSSSVVLTFCDDCSPPTHVYSIYGGSAT